MLINFFRERGRGRRERDRETETPCEREISIRCLLMYEPGQGIETET